MGQPCYWLQTHLSDFWGVWSWESIHAPCPCPPILPIFSMAVWSCSPISHSSLVPFLILPLKSSHTRVVPSFQGTQKKINIRKAFIHDFSHSKVYHTSYRGLPHGHLCLVTISLATAFPMASWRSFWSSSRALVSRACLLLLGLINITSFSVCLSEIIDYCSTTVEWQRVLMNFRKKSKKKKSTMDFVEKEKPKNLSFFCCLDSYKQLCLEKWSFKSWMISPSHQDFGGSPVVLGFFFNLLWILETLQMRPCLSHKGNTYHSVWCHLPGILRALCFEILTTILDCAFLFFGRKS